MFKSKRTKIIFLVVDTLILIGLIAAVIVAQTEEVQVDGDQQNNVNQYYSRFIEHEGKVYPVKRGIQTLLLIGKDAMEGRRPVSDIETFYNDDLADFLLVLAFDHENKTVTPLEINRDTMCDVPWLSVNGLVGGYARLQVTMAHIFGTGKQDSSKNVVTAVTGLLYGAPIDHYFTFTMDTVPIINDLVGGVTITLEDDVPTLGPDYVRGKTITLRGNEALRFVRARDVNVIDSNVSRMGHQRLYMNAFINQAGEKMKQDQDFILRAYDRVERFLTTDLTVETVSELINDFYEYEVLPIQTYSGSYSWSEVETAQFEPDAESLWTCVRNTFCR